MHRTDFIKAPELFAPYHTIIAAAFYLARAYRGWYLRIEWHRTIAALSLIKENLERGIKQLPNVARTPLPKELKNKVVLRFFFRNILQGVQKPVLKEQAVSENAVSNSDVK